MKKLITVIVEDNRPAREYLKAELSRFKEIEFVGEAEGVVSGLKLIRKKQPDLLFLDIELKDGNGFDLLEISGQRPYQVIFITASNQHAIKAFQFAAIDYLLKPPDPDLLEKAIRKAKLKLPHSPEQNEIFRTTLDTTKEPEKIVLHTQEKIFITKINEIIRCEAMGNYTRFYLDGEQNILVSKTLKEFSEILESSGFIRTHQSHMINREYIRAYIKTEGGCILMENGTRIPVSYRKRSSVLKSLDEIN